MAPQTGISENSRRIARNTVLLYCRMFVLMLVGLFTSRVVLRSLGVSDYGVYNAVGDVVMGFTFITASLSAAISRYMAHGLGTGDEGAQRRIFSTAVIIQIATSVLLVLLVETAGLHLLRSSLNIPAGRESAAFWVLQCSLGALVLNLLSVPFNACIIAHEKMGAFAAISLVEGGLKLAVALLLAASPYDRLKTYAFLMLAVALVVRLCYGIYCTRKFAESRGKVVFDASLLREMAGFAGWNFFGSSAWVLNTRGVNLVVNVFFGVALNAARGVAAQVEGIVKQFATNLLTAFNPQIVKTWASGNREYCFELVRKGAKYTFWIILLLSIPLWIWTPQLLGLWLVDVPEHSVLFVRLTLLCLLVDMTGNTLVTLVQATGEVRRYYLVTGLVSYLCLPAVWVAFKLGAPAFWAYICFIAVYLAVFFVKLALVHSQTGFPVGRFLRGLFTVTPGEMEFLLRKTGRFLPDRLYLKARYRVVFGRRLNLRHPRRYTEQLQWLKLRDRNPLWHTLADKVAVKERVARAIGAEYVVPTLGVWNCAADIDWDSLPEQFVLKCSHDSGSTVVCRSKAGFDFSGASRSLDAALGRDFSRQDRQWAYKGIRGRILAEEWLGEDPADYKFFCFDGRPEYMFIATERGSRGETKFDFFDMEGRHLDLRNGHPCAAAVPALPRGFETMKKLAATLSEGMRHVRVDFYEIEGKIYFGEYTFYHWGGFVPFDPDSADYDFGKFLKI